MNRAIEALRSSMNRVQHLGGLHEALSSLTTCAVDASDILRAQIVLGVSALDYYIHEITAIGMVEVFQGKRPHTPSFIKYRVSMQSMFSGSSSWFESDVRDRNSYLSFQQPEKIAEAIRFFSQVKLWQEVSALLATPEQDVKNRLKLIVERRNKIAHEADIDPSYPNARWPITQSDVDTSLSFLSKVCENIHTVVK